jgi:hypothetical protein
MHTTFCFGGQSAPSPGYFTNDTLPCICHSRESLLLALSQVATPYVPLKDMAIPVVRLLPLSA